MDRMTAKMDSMTDSMDRMTDRMTDRMDKMEKGMIDKMDKMDKGITTEITNEITNEMTKRMENSKVQNLVSNHWFRDSEWLSLRTMIVTRFMVKYDEKFIMTNNNGIFIIGKKTPEPFDKLKSIPVEDILDYTIKQNFTLNDYTKRCLIQNLSFEHPSTLDKYADSFHEIISYKLKYGDFESNTQKDE